MTTDLPLLLCRFLDLISVEFTYYRTYWMYEILLFWGIAGTSQAIITPDIPAEFPVFNFFRSWTAYLVLFTIMAIWHRRF
ncbi:TMEM164 family acyltransferase [Bizionia saleffrena]